MNSPKSETMRTLTIERNLYYVSACILILLGYLGEFGLVHAGDAYLYSQCEIDKPKPWKEKPKEVGWDPDSVRIFGTQFGCHGARCCVQNEATFLGIHAENDGNFLYGEKWREITRDFFRISLRRKDMEVYEKFKNAPDSVFKMFPPPTYYEKTSNFPETKPFIPQVCDFRAFLYCETKSAHESRCMCHPLYSSSLESKDYVCRGRAGVPCGYKSVADGYPASEDSSLEDSINKSKCGEGLACKNMTRTELGDFRAGRMWKGFGYSPITVRFVLEQATHICKCTGKNKERNSMHGCS